MQRTGNVRCPVHLLSGLRCLWVSFFLRLPFETIWGGSLRFDPGGSAGRAREALLSPVS